MNWLLILVLLVLPSMGWADVRTHATNCADITCTTARNGQECYQTDTNVLYVCDGPATTWTDVASGGGGHTPEGTAVLSTGELITEYLRADGDNTSSWQVITHTATAITDDLIVEADLDEDSGTPTDEDVLTYDSTGADFNWAAQSTLAAGTAAALAANGGNCAAGEIALGVDAAGAVETCYEPTEADITDLVHTGDITKVGTPVDDEIGVWTGDGTLEGDTNFQWDGTSLSVGGNVVQTIGTRNVIIGDVTTGNGGVTTDSVVIGDAAGAGMLTTGDRNITIGTNAGTAITTGDDSVVIGYDAGASLAGAGAVGTFVGSNAGKLTTGSGNTFVGYHTGAANTTSVENTFIGFNSGLIATGARNTFIGANVGVTVTTGDDNALIGVLAAPALTTGSANVVVGPNAGTLLVDGDFNTIVGKQAGSGGDFSNGTFFGYQAGRLTTGAENTMVGAFAGQLHTSGASNSYLGYLAGATSTTGGNNTAMGRSALQLNVSGNQNVAIGQDALQNANAGSDQNTAVGVRALEGNSNERFRNVGMGFRAGDSITTGDDNIIIGTIAGQTMTTANKNTILGNYAGFAVTGSSNVFIGYSAARDAAAVSDMLIIDNRDQGSEAAELTDALIVGNFHATPASQTLRFNADVAVTYDLAVEGTITGLQPVIEDATASTTLNAIDQLGGTMVYMEHTAAVQDITLATAVAGAHVCFNNFASGGFEKAITPDPSDTIYLNGISLGNGESLFSAILGESVCLKGKDTATWVVAGNDGWALWADPVGYDEYDTDVTPVAVATADCANRRHVSINTTGTVEFDLPATPGVGDICRFIRLGAGLLKIDPDASDTILGTDGAGDFIVTGGNAGNTIVLEAVTTGSWAVQRFNGSWDKE